MTDKTKKTAKGQKPRVKSKMLGELPPGFEEIPVAKVAPATEALPRKKKSKTPEWVKRAADRAEGKGGPEAEEEVDEKASDKKGTKKAKVTPLEKAEAEVVELRAALEAFMETSGPRMGRPPKYKPEFAAVARALCKRGATDFELAQEFGVDVKTISRWKVAYDDFCQALKIHKGDFDAQIERSLALRANGFTVESEKVFCNMGRVTRAKVNEYYPPDVGAMKLWLTNRDPENWRDKTSTEVTGKDGGAIEIRSTARERVAGKLAELAKRSEGK